MSSNIEHAVAQNGFVLVKQHAPELCTLDAIASLGSILTLDGFSAIQELRPRIASTALPNTYSGNFGTADFPMHTDLAQWVVPPRYIALRCIKGAQDVATRIFDGNLMVEEIGATLMHRILVQPRRPLRNGKQLLRLLDFFDAYDSPILRWDSIFLRPATAESEAAHTTVRDYIADIIPKEIVLLTLGDTLIIDNWRMLHGRSPAPAPTADRHIDRVYMGGIH
jgi:L-asparagine oxygenase